jgi:epoxyqueuosine reductase
MEGVSAPCQLSVEDLRTIGLAAGLVAVGVTGVEPFLDTRAVLEERRERGLNGAMQFTYRNPTRSTEPAALLRDAASLIVGAWPYAGGEMGDGGMESSSPKRPMGTVARYATEDHYAGLRGALASIAAELESAGHRTRIVADDNALVDRAAAHRAGIGWFGKNANILVPGHGSWVLLGAVVTDAVLEASDPIADGCGSCQRCSDGCPTGAIIAPGVVDARRCLAWIVQAGGSIPLEFREALHDRIYGCDDCQEVCPPSRRSPEGSLAVGDGSHVDLLALLAATDEELVERHGRWYIADRDARHLKRNALVALGNIASPEDQRVRGVLHDIAGTHDELLAEHAHWALSRLDARGGVPG